MRFFPGLRCTNLKKMTKRIAIAPMLRIQKSGSIMSNLIPIIEEFEPNEENKLFRRNSNGTIQTKNDMMPLFFDIRLIRNSPIYPIIIHGDNAGT